MDIIITFATVLLVRYLCCYALGRNEVIDQMVNTNKDLQDAIEALGKINCELKLMNKHLGKQ